MFITKPPTFITFDNNLLHNTTRAAVEYEDGYKQHYLWGTYFSEELFTKLINKTITPKDIVTHDNLEQKASMIRYVGYEKIIKELGNQAKLLDKINDNVFGGEVSYELYDVQLTEQLTHRIIKVMWYDKHGKLDTTFIGVPRQDNTKTCKGALAWCNPLLKPEEAEYYEEQVST